MAITVTQGPLDVTDITAAAATAGFGQAPDRRMLYGPFGDRMATLMPEQSPFYVYTSRVRKESTSSQIFRFLEDRVATQSYDRTFLIANSPNTAPGTVVADSSYAFSIDSSAASVNWLIKGHVFVVRTTDDSGDLGYSQILVRVDSAPVDDGSTTSFTGRVLDLTEVTPSGYNSIDDNQECRVIGTAFQENTGTPDVWSEDIEDGFGYTQIWKTAAELSNSAIATEFRGYRNEWLRIWNLKLIEHKAMIESTLLFGQRTRSNGILTTAGIVGDIIKNTTLELTDATDLSYTAGQYYGRSLALGGLIYDQFLRDGEVLFDEARGGSKDKLVLTAPQVMTRFHRIGDNQGFIPNTGGGAGEYRYNADSFFDNKTGKFGVKVTEIDTLYGTYHLVKEPMFRGPQDRFMVFVDLAHVAYRPLVGNGKNRDTTIETNVQANGQDGRKDQILTEAGLEITMPETHMLYHLEDN